MSPVSESLLFTRKLELSIVGRRAHKNFTRSRIAGHMKVYGVWSRTMYNYSRPKLIHSCQITPAICLPIANSPNDSLSTPCTGRARRQFWGQSNPYSVFQTTETWLGIFVKNANKHSSNIHASGLRGSSHASRELYKSSSKKCNRHALCKGGKGFHWPPRQFRSIFFPRPLLDRPCRWASKLNSRQLQLGCRQHRPVCNWRSRPRQLDRRERLRPEFHRSDRRKRLL